MKDVTRILALAILVTSASALHANEDDLRAMLRDQLWEQPCSSSFYAQFHTREPKDIIAARADGVRSPVFGQSQVPDWALEELADSMVALPSKMLGWSRHAERFCKADQDMITHGFITWSEGVCLMLYLCAKQGRDPIVFLPISWGPNDMFVPSIQNHLPAWLSWVQEHFVTLGVPFNLIEDEFRRIDRFVHGRGRWGEIFRS